MLFRFLFSLLLVGSLSVTASAQSGSNPCAELAKKPTHQQSPAGKAPGRLPQSHSVLP